ncbi:MAG: aminotransferase class III-fold pyridoxal phosphate-dependent enzyme [Oligoflexia bacterium]|nr:aminotransferase class III-fold pyridoxal phosphate-dependent enzyme [Oligoflexia bacterium]
MNEENYPKELSKKMIAELNDYVIVDTYPFVIDLKRSHGPWMVTVDGDEIFDWTGLYGSRLLGHNHPRMRESEYVERLIVAANNKMANPDFLTEECLSYYRLLYKLRPKCYHSQKAEVYVVNSGAEAVENMMKYMINLHREKLQQQNKNVSAKRFLYFDQAFHGRTIFTLNITQLKHDPLLTRDYQGLVPGNLKVPFPATDNSRSYEENKKEMQEALSHIEILMKTYNDEIIAVILEPIQGAGGQRVALPEFYNGLSMLCQKYQIFWGVDEVQTSGGVTGKFFCIDNFDIPNPPQAIASAKKMANGVLYMLRSMKDVGVLDSTWGGNLADMVRFQQEWKIIEEEGYFTSVLDKSKYFIERLCDLEKKYSNIIFNVRGMGLYQGFSMRNSKDKGRLINLALEKENLLLLGAGDYSIRFRPSIDITKDEISLLITKLDTTLTALKHLNS